MKHLFLFSLLACLITCGLGQVPALPNVVPPSPTSMQFQRFGDYPVNYYTGTPSISIPLYTIAMGDIQVPITLNYHASGCRPDDVSGFVGLGWTLDCGGMLTRNVNGLPDEASNFLVPTQTAGNINYQTQSQLLDDLEGGVYDHEYDIWSFNFLGNSGKYINLPTGAFVIDNKNNLQVSHGIIKDANGIEYGFGDNGGAESTTYTDPVTAWVKDAVTTMPLVYIKSAIDPNNYVGYNYHAGPAYQTTKPSDAYFFDDFWNGASILSSNDFYYARTNNGGLNQSNYLMRNFTNVIDEITFRSGKVKFHQDPATKMLSYIEVLDMNNAVIRKIELNIVPFPSAYAANPFANYKLQSVSFKDASNSTGESYSFNYQDEQIADAKPNAFVPNAGKDYWGFYNADDGKVSRIPQYANFSTRGDAGSPSSGTVGGNAILDVSESKTMTYVLNKLTYPTGGYTTFEFEGNKDNYNQPVGGLRIKHIRSYTGDNQLATQKTYSYAYYGGGTEIIPSIDHYTKSTLTYFGYNIFARRVTIAENPCVDYSPKGSPIGYDMVTETDNNSTQTYFYDNGPAYTYEQLNFPAINYLTSPPQNSYYKTFVNHYKPWNYGNLLGKDNGVEGEAYEYEEYTLDTIRDFIIERWIQRECLVSGAPYDCGTSFPPGSSFDVSFASAGWNVFNYADRYYHSGGVRVKKKTVTYSGVASVVEYFYENPLQPTVATKTVTTNAKGDTLVTTLKHPFDYTASPYDEMVNRHIVSPVIESKETNQTLNQEVSKFTSLYSLWQGNTLLLPSQVQKSVGGNPLETEFTVNNYDGKGNPLELAKKDGVTVSYIWGYGKLYPIAEIVGADYNSAISYVSQSVLDNPATTEAQMRTELNKIRTGLASAGSKAFVSTFTYRPLIGKTSETGPNGRTAYYEYDSFNRLKLIRDQDGKVLKVFDYKYQANTNY